MADKGKIDHRKINKLEREIEQMELQLTLEKKEADLIKEYQMKEGTYQIIITVYEASELEPRGTNFWLFQTHKTACDAFVEIQVRDQVKKSSVRDGTNNPIFDEQFYFKFQDMTLEDLDRSSITLTVYDKKTFILSDSLLGSFTLDWTNVYFKRNHQIYRGWLMLSDPEDVVEGVIGYLLVNVAVLGPADKVTVHDSAFIKDPLTTMEDTVTMPKLQLIDYAISIEIYRAENLVPLDEFNADVDAYVIAKFSGNKVQTSTVTSGVNPEWNQLLKIGTGVPTKSKYVILQVRNKNLLGKDDIIGVIKIPLIQLEEESEPQWGHLYGPPLAGEDKEPYNHVTKMQVYGQDIGSHYRGRLMYKITGVKDALTKNKKSKINFQFPYKPTPSVPTKGYTLRVQLLQGFALPLNEECYIHVCIGQHFLLSKSYGKHKDNYLQFYDSFPDKKIQLPEDVAQIPNLIIYFAKGKKEKDRISFLRVKAEEIAVDSDSNIMKIYELKPDLSLGLAQPGKDSGGFITARIHLYKFKVPPPVNIRKQFQTKKDYVLKMFLYQGEGFPPANPTGQTDPFVSFNFLGEKAESSSCKGTYNPIWNEVITMKLKIQDLMGLRMEKGMICKLYDWEDGLTGHNYIGEFLVKFRSQMRKSFQDEKKNKREFIYRKPQWYPVLNDYIEIGDKCLGKVLMTFALFREEDFNCLHSEALNKISTKVKDKNVQLFLIGVRDVQLNDSYLSNNKMKLGICMPTWLTDQQAMDQKEKNKNLSDTKSMKNKFSDQSRIIIKSSKSISSKGKSQNEQKSQKNQILSQISKFSQKLSGREKSEKKIEEKKNQMQPQKQAYYSKEQVTPEYTIKNNCASLNEIKCFNVKLPKNKGLTPFVDFKVYEDGKFIAYNSISLYYILPKLLEDDDDEEEQTKKKVQSDSDSEETILDVEKLEAQLNVVRERKKKNDQKAKKAKATQKKVEELLLPNELGGKVFGDVQNEKYQQSFEKLMKEYMEQKKDDPQFDYVKSLQNQNGNKKNQTLSKMSKIDKERKQLEIQESRSDKRSQIQGRNLLEDRQGGMKMVKDKSEDEENLAFSEQHIKKAGFEEEMPESGNQLSPMKDNMSEKHEKEEDMKKSDYLEIASEGMKKKKFTKRQEMSIYNNSQKAREDNVLDLKTRYTLTTDETAADQALTLLSEKTLHDFDIKENDQIEQMKYRQKAIRFEDVEGYIKQEEKFTKEAMERDAAFKYAAAVKLSLFQWRKDKKKTDQETYQDYDTDPDQDLDIIPQWYKGRKILSTDLEELLQNKKRIVALPLYTGGKRLGNLDVRAKEKIGCLKFVAISETEEVANERAAYYQKLLKTKQFICRFYVLKGKSLISNFEGKPTTYLKFSSKGVDYDLKERTLNKECYNPEYYICQQIAMELPGASTVRISVMEMDGVLGNLTPKVLGYTDIDIEERYFMKKWHLFIGKKPIQLRNLYSEYGIGSQGRLQVWIDLVEKKNWLSSPPYKIHPPPFDDFELRTIVYSTKDCVYKNEAFQSNDVYVRGMVGTSPAQETDTHWACRSVGNFNYRFKFKVAYPPKPEDMYSDIFTIQIWDRDLIGYNNLIGETRINLNKIHKIIQKAVKRKKAVKGSMKIKEKGLLLTDKMWFDVYNHKVKNQFGQLQSQGKVQLSFELVPLKIAEEDLQNGYGRSQPNVYPTLQEPAGRLSFNFFHPLDFFKQLLGPNLYNSCCMKLCCCLGIIIAVVLGYFVIGQVIAAAIVG